MAASSHLVGFHASAAGCVSNAIRLASRAGARAVALFTRSARRWDCPPMDDESPARFAAACTEHGFDRRAILPHGSYLINLATSNPEVREKSLTALIDEVKRCAALGLQFYNFHPGSASGCSAEQGCSNVADGINQVHAAVPGDLVLVVEMMAGGGACIGTTLEEIAAIISGVHDKSRVGVCVDTAHVHGAGYDIRNAETWQAFMRDLDRIVGLKYLRGMHLNDSRVELGTKRDRHANIGCGHVGIEGFRAIMNDKRTAGIPLILETPSPGSDFQLEEDDDDLLPAATPAKLNGADTPSAADRDEALARKPKSKKAEVEERCVQLYGQEIRLLYSLIGTLPGDPLTVQPVSAKMQFLPVSKAEMKRREKLAQALASAAAVDAVNSVSALVDGVEGAKPVQPGKRRRGKPVVAVVAEAAVETTSTTDVMAAPGSAPRKRTKTAVRVQTAASATAIEVAPATPTIAPADADATEPVVGPKKHGHRARAPRKPQAAAMIAGSDGAPSHTADELAGADVAPTARKRGGKQKMVADITADVLARSTGRRRRAQS